MAHKCDEEKIQAIRKAGISAIEIDLNGFDRDTTKESLRNILIDEESYKRWIYNRKAALFEEHDQYGMPEAKKLPGVVVYDADDIAHGLVSTPRGQGKVMPYCPFTTPNLHYGHCETCPYCIDVTYGSSTRWYDVPVYVYCHPPDNQGKGN